MILINKHNPFMFFAMVDNNNAMFYKDKDNNIKLPKNIDAHIKRLDELSQECTVIIDDVFLEACNYKSPFEGNKFLYIMCEDYGATAEHVNERDSKYMRFRPYADLDDTVKGHEQFKDMPLFYCGSSKLLKLSRKYIDHLLLTKVETTNNDEVYDTFDNELLERYYKLTSTNTPCDERFKESNKKCIINEEIINGSMKIIRKVKNTNTTNFYFEFQDYRKLRKPRNLNH